MPFTVPPGARVTVSYLPPEARRISVFVHATGGCLDFVGDLTTDTLVACGHVHPKTVLDLRGTVVTVTENRKITKRQRRHEARVWTRGRRRARRVPMSTVVTGYVTKVTASMGPGVGHYRIGIHARPTPLTPPRSSPRTAPAGRSDSPGSAASPS